MSKDVDVQEIIHPSDEHNRTENLLLLYNKLRESPGSPVDKDLKEFLNSYVTKDFKQAALVGLTLLLLKTAQGEDASLYARLFPALYLQQEPELRKAVVEAMPKVTPLKLYDELAEITVYGDPRSAAYHYAYQVMSNISPDNLKSDFKDYL